MIGLVAKLLEAPLAIADSPVARRDAIVVLGAPLTPAGELTPILDERVAAAVALYRAVGADYVVASGGTTQGAPRAEADALAAGLRAAGIPEVLVEARSLTTAQNARFTAELLAPLGVRTLWIVTQPFHARRAALLFRRAGFDARAWHITDSVQYRDRRRALRWLVREYASWAALAARGQR
ncbi:MAG TPA: YdcF family protein [Kofleriaceae bacterium]